MTKPRRKSKKKPHVWPMPFPPPTRPTEGRGLRVVDMFGVEWPDVVEPVKHDVAPPDIGQILLLVGPSGGGKSSLLRRLISNLPGTIRVDRMPLPDRPVIDLFDHVDILTALRLLGSVGLGEVWTYLRQPSELSDGQRFRLKLALALEEAGEADGPATLVIDEFTSPLDRITAAVVAHSLQKIVRRQANLSAIVATCHDDVERPLRPDRVVRCDFDRVIERT
jgi:ABC-type ATPase with predicted acetyltransferase domain